MLHKVVRCRLGATTSATGEARVRGLDRAHSSRCGRLSPPRAPRENHVGKVLATRAAFESGMSAARGEAVGGLYGLKFAGWCGDAGEGMQARLWWHGRRGAPCGRLLEADDDVDAAARGVCERLFGLVAEGSVLETVKREHESGEGESARVKR